MVACREKEGQKWIAQDAWAISVHGSEVRLITTHFTETYLAYVNSPQIPTTEYQVVYRSKPFNLKYDEGTIEALRAVMALISWVRGGKSKQVLVDLVRSDC